MIIIRFMQNNSIILNRLVKNLKSRTNYLKQNNISAYRLYEKDIPEYPFIVDIYNDYAVIYEKGKKIPADNIDLQRKAKKHRLDMIEAIKEVLTIDPHNILFKFRKKQEGKKQYEKLGQSHNFLVAQEGSFKFRVNLYDYLDTGLFLDHRPLRKWVFNEAEGKRVLNLFAYTGSISVAAALGGGKVTTVDMSKTYLDWARENFKLNQINLDKHQFIQTDAVEYIQALDQVYDIIVLDPPSFSNSKRMEESFDVQSAHEHLLNKLMNQLDPKGVLYFSTNFRKFQLSPLLAEKYVIEDKTKASIPQDFRDAKIHYCYKIRKKKDL